MKVTNKAQVGNHKHIVQEAKVVGASNSKVQANLSEGFSSTPAAIFKSSTKDDYNTSTLNPLQKRVLSLQEQITNLNSDEKMDNDTKNSQLEPLQEELASVQEQFLKQQEDALVTDISQKTDNKGLVAGYSQHVYKDGCDGCIDYTNPDYYKDQDYKDFVSECYKEGYTDEQIYGFTHIVTAPEIEMGSHIWEINDMVKDICDKNGFNYYERPGHMPDMEAILEENGIAAYEAMNRAFSDFEKNIWLQGSKDREGFSVFQRKLREQGLQSDQKVPSTNNGGFGGSIWKILIPPSPDPNDTQDPLKFIGKARTGMAKKDTLLVKDQDAQEDDTAKKKMSRLQSRMLSLQAQITKLGRDKKMDEETKTHLIKSLQGQLLEVVEQMEHQKQESSALEVMQG